VHADIKGMNTQFKHARAQEARAKLQSERRHSIQTVMSAANQRHKELTKPIHEIRIINNAVDKRSHRESLPQALS